MKFTLFTPTYNRVHLLPKLYKSLVKQKSYDFEWLVVDDGSSDGTMEYIKGLMDADTTPFPIRYFWQPNGGKHRAFNKAIEEANSEWFVCIDSDDPLTDDAIVNMNYASTMVDDDAAGFVGICVNESGERLEKKIRQPFYSDTIEIRDTYKIWGEPEVYKLTILKPYRFPEYEGELFVTEAILFDQLTQKHKLLYTNFPLQVKQYLQGGLTDRQTEIRIQSPNATLAYYLQRFKLTNVLKYRIKALLNYGRFLIHAQLRHKKLYQPIYKYVYGVYPLCVMLCLIDYGKLRK